MKNLKLKRHEILVLRTCNKDMTSHEGSKWKKSGLVSAPGLPSGSSSPKNELLQDELAKILTDNLFDSKDWRSGNLLERVRWLISMYNAKKKELDDMLDQLSNGVWRLCSDEEIRAAEAKINKG